MTEDIVIVREIVSILQQSQSLNTDEENYQNVLDHCREYLKTHCSHRIVTDDIDIDPDKSQRVRYCDECYVTFR